MKLVGYFSRDLYRLAFQYDLEFGILLIALGVIVLLRTNGVMDFICIAAGVSILADGLFKIQIAIDARRFGIRDWWLILLLAVVTGGVGLGNIKLENVTVLGRIIASGADGAAGRGAAGGGRAESVRGPQHGEDREEPAAGRDRDGVFRGTGVPVIIVKKGS